MQIERFTHAGRMTNYRVATAGSWFVCAWLVGLLVAPAAPPADAPAAVVAAHFAAHAWSTTFQSVLVHGIAGVALLVIARSLAAGRAARLAGTAAAVTSLVQAAVGVALSQVVAERSSAQSASALFDVINTADTVKLLFLAAFVALASRAFGPRLRAAGLVVAPLLAIGGLAFVVPSDALSAVLVASLPALLLWVGGVAFLAWRPARPATA
jgi:hypothetical protein